MITVNAYLTFNGNCKQAFDFYQSIFGGAFTYEGRYESMPIQEGIPPIPEDMKDKIMHISLPISKETCIMGSDAGGAWSKAVTMGDNFTLSVSADSVEAADTLFNALVQGGQATMPMSYTFWGSYFGMLKDQFGIHWMLNHEPAAHKEFEQKHA